MIAKWVGALLIVAGTLLGIQTARVMILTSDLRVANAAMDKLLADVSVTVCASDYHGDRPCRIRSNGTNDAIALRSAVYEANQLHKSEIFIFNGNYSLSEAIDFGDLSLRGR